MSKLSTWRMTIEGNVYLVSPVGSTPIIIEGTGPVPVVQQVAGPSVAGSPVVGSPVVGSPPPPPPRVEPVDTSPFTWPTDGPAYPYQDGDRYFVLDGTPGSQGSHFYAAETSTGNPLQTSHRNAGIIADGARTAPGPGYPDGKNVGGYRLWVPADAPPALIRKALRDGHL